MKRDRPIVHGRDHFHGNTDEVRIEYESLSGGAGGGVPLAWATISRTGTQGTVSGTNTDIVFDTFATSDPSVFTQPDPTHLQLNAPGAYLVMSQAGWVTAVAGPKHIYLAPSVAPAAAFTGSLANLLSAAGVNAAYTSPYAHADAAMILIPSGAGPRTVALEAGQASGSPQTLDVGAKMVAYYWPTSGGGGGSAGGYGDFIELTQTVAGSVATMRWQLNETSDPSMFYIDSGDDTKIHVDSDGYFLVTAEVSLGFSLPVTVPSNLIVNVTNLRQTAFLTKGLTAADWPASITDLGLLTQPVHQLVPTVYTATYQPVMANVNPGITRMKFWKLG